MNVLDITKGDRIFTNLQNVKYYFLTRKEKKEHSKIIVVRKLGKVVIQRRIQDYTDAVMFYYGVCQCEKCGAPAYVMTKEKGSITYDYSCEECFDKVKDAIDNLGLKVNVNYLPKAFHIELDEKCCHNGCDKKANNFIKSDYFNGVYYTCNEHQLQMIKFLDNENCNYKCYMEMCEKGERN